MFSLKIWSPEWQRSKSRSWENDSLIKKNYSLNANGENLGHDRKIHRLKHCSNDYERCQSQSLWKYSLNQILIRWMGKGWISVVIERFTKSNADLLTTEKAIWQNRAAGRIGLLLQMPIHWMWKDWISVVIERFTESNADPLNGKGVNLSLDRKFLCFKHWLKKCIRTESQHDKIICWFKLSFSECKRSESLSRFRVNLSRFRYRFTDRGRIEFESWKNDSVIQAMIH